MTEYNKNYFGVVNKIGHYFIQDFFVSVTSQL